MDLQQRISRAIEQIEYIEGEEWPSLRAQLLASQPGSPERQELKKKADGLWWKFQTYQSILRVSRRSESLEEIENFVKGLGEEDGRK